MNRLLIHPGRGDGSFGVAIGYDGGEGPYRGAVLDLDSDTDADVLLLTLPGDGEYLVQSLLQTRGDPPDGGFVSTLAAHVGGEVEVTWTVSAGHGFTEFVVEGSGTSAGPWEEIARVIATSALTYTHREPYDPSRSWVRVVGIGATGNVTSPALFIEVEFVPGMVSRPAPNPFPDGVSFSVDVPRDGAPLAVDVFDLAGRRVRSMWRGTSPRGRQSFEWMGRTDEDRAVAVGTYWIRVRIDGREETQRVLKLR